MTLLFLTGCCQSNVPEVCTQTVPDTLGYAYGNWFIAERCIAKTTGCGDYVVESVGDSLVWRKT